MVEGRTLAGDLIVVVAKMGFTERIKLHRESFARERSVPVAAFG